MKRANLCDSVAKSMNYFLVEDLVYSTPLEECKGGGTGESRE